MSSCDAIMSKLDSIQSKMGDVDLSSLENKLDKLNDNFNKFQDDLVEAMNANAEVNSEEFKALNEYKVGVLNALKKLSENQVNDNEILKIITDGIGKSAQISLANNEYLKNLQQTNGAIPRDVLVQISNIEAVAKVLNKVYLGG